jgi:type IV pilus assembly protein PilY1
MARITRLLCLLISVTLSFTPMSVYPAFDPVNDDTDIFIANPNINALRPNVVIILDNTANWNQPFTNEKSALVTVVNRLSNVFNVGLMMMAETGSPNDNQDGAYVRFHVRQMTSGFDAKGNPDGSPNVKGALADLVGSLDILADKGNNNTLGLALYEAYLYYAGKASRASYGKIKTDYDNTTDSRLQGALSGAGPRALPSSSPPTPPRPKASDLYRSPASDGCQKNYIIYISNGPVNENASARAELEARLTEIKGGTPPTIIDVSGFGPTGQQANWGDEMAEFMANADVNATLPGVQNVFTYVVEVNPTTTGQGPDTTALMKSTGTKGKGGYFAVTDDASGVAIVDVLTAIFDEIQAVNSVFAASTLPVSINPRGVNLNQVYIGVFRPDAKKAPRWLGNLKLYQLALSGGDVILADANGNPAANPGTNRLRPDGTSFWTQPST